ncbi:MAG: hypothetical protein HYZ28_09370 [Myxococcales bacterium]|nr:hypothetical protein [Myxococcales bacterium]
MRRNLVKMALGLLLGATSAYAAGERIAVVSPPGPAVEFPGQLAEALCVSLTCVPGTKVMTGTRPDFAKAAHERLVAVVTGRLLRGASGPEVEVTIHSRDGATMIRSTIPANGNGRVSAIDLVAAATKIHRAIEYPEKALKAQAKEKDKEQKLAKAKALKGKKAKALARAKAKRGKATKIVASKPSVRPSRS